MPSDYYVALVGGVTGAPRPYRLRGGKILEPYGNVPGGITAEFTAAGGGSVPKRRVVQIGNRSFWVNSGTIYELQPNNPNGTWTSVFTLPPAGQNDHFSGFFHWGNKATGDWGLIAMYVQAAVSGYRTLRYHYPTNTWSTVAGAAYNQLGGTNFGAVMHRGQLINSYYHQTGVMLLDPSVYPLPASETVIATSYNNQSTGNQEMVSADNKVFSVYFGVSTSQLILVEILPAFSVLRAAITNASFNDVTWHLSGRGCAWYDRSTNSIMIVSMDSTVTPIHYQIDLTTFTPTLRNAGATTAGLRRWTPRRTEPSGRTSGGLRAPCPPTSSTNSTGRATPGPTSAPAS
jgi:hypothetical protein